jgi:hypothetical protein
MGTTLDQILDLFLSLINDYRLTGIFTASGSMAFSIYAEPWILFAVTELSPISNQPLNYTQTSGSQIGYFDTVLNMENQLLLAQICVKYWLMKSVQDVLQFNLTISDHDFKTYSQAQNLQIKQQYYIAKKEEIAQMLTEYAYRNANWSNWQNQIFS